MSCLSLIHTCYTSIGIEPREKNCGKMFFYQGIVNISFAADNGQRKLDRVLPTKCNQQTWRQVGGEAERDPNTKMTA